MGLFSSIVGAVAGPIIGGLFGNKANKDNRKEQRDAPRRNLMSQAQGAREAAAKYGFNPLTMMQYGQTGATAGGTAAPLASAEMIAGAIKDVLDVTSGDAARRRAQEQHNLDLAKVQLDQARSGVVLHPRNQTDAVGSGLSPIGYGTSTAVPSTGAVPRPPRFSKGENPVAPGRATEIAPLTNTPGVFELENTWTGGYPITIPGDGEPWGLDELGTAVIVGVPQAVDNYIGGGKTLRERFDKNFTPQPGSIAERLSDWWKDDEPSKKGK